MSEQSKCELCGLPMPKGEEMFKYHGYSGPCPNKDEFGRPAEAPAPAQPLPTIQEMSGSIDFGGRVVFEDGEPVVIPMPALPAPPAEPSVERPRYWKVQHDNNSATKTFMVVCNEGWRESIVCGSMYEWAADWLIERIQGEPYAPGKH